ncbi:unnamed protein product [Owenia fusiformis]|uniref:Uncharacterized protein n=1 Tax=Owenia fusiformis TaxID=6347 RepID=A0A8J1XJ00_OWEFU|nr:unnamed protein product [Owenia fusiformis]
MEVARFVVVLRNPKSVLVSNHIASYGTVTDYFDVVPTYDQSIDAMLTDSQDQHLYGTWFNHISTWWVNRDKMMGNIHFIFYEDMKKNMEDVIKGLGMFLNKNVSNDRIEKMVEYLQFEQMLKDSKTGKAFENFNLPVDADAFKCAHMRTGVIDDWKTKLTVAQSERMDEYLRPKLDKIGLEFQYE